MKRALVIAGVFALLLLSCGPRKKSAAPPPALREFPRVEVPAMLTDPSQRAEWLVMHFWDRFTDTTACMRCDSTTLNGVPRGSVGDQAGLYAMFLQEVPLEMAHRSVCQLHERLCTFERAFPESGLLPGVARLVVNYLYDPTSPVRSEDICLPLADLLSRNDLLPPVERQRYGWTARTCSMNRTGTPAADFSFVDRNGRTRTLYSIRAHRVLLIFGNPDCEACQELVAQMEAMPEVSGQIQSGELKVVDIYIDEDIALWKQKVDSYPASWIVGYDPSFTIRADHLYSVRAMPSMYLLDAQKRVLVKDADEQQILSVL